MLVCISRILGFFVFVLFFVFVVLFVFILVHVQIVRFELYVF